MATDLRGITRESTYDVLYAKLLEVNSEAMRTAPSPAHEYLHTQVDILLDYMGYAHE